MALRTGPVLRLLEIPFNFIRADPCYSWALNHFSIEYIAASLYPSVELK